MKSACATSIRKPSTPRSSQKRRIRVELVLHRLVVPVEVGLLGREEVEVVLAGGVVSRPRRPAESRGPLVRAASGFAGAEEVVPPVGVTRVGDRVLEPLVLVGRVVRDDVDRDPEPELVRVGDERVEVVERAELWVDVDVVGDVIAVVSLW